MGAAALVGTVGYGGAKRRLTPGGEAVSLRM